MEDIKAFITTNQSVLTEFSANFFRSLALTKQLKNTAQFMKDSIACGVALALRKVIEL